MQFSFERYEKKYLLSAEQQASFLDKMRPYVQADRYSNYTICNLYYDTDDWRLIRASLGKPVYKEKLRVRSYGVPGNMDSVFVELKKKFDGIVYKRRITTGLNEVAPLLNGDIPAERYGQIGKELAWFQSFYRTEPKVFIGYDRQAFMGIEDPSLRITFDTNLRWRTTELSLSAGDHGAPITMAGDVLLELKLPAACPLWLSRLLSEAGAFPVSFSKYGSWYQNDLPMGENVKEALRCA